MRWIWLVLFGLIACAAPKHATHKPPVKEPPPPTQSEDKVKVYDPVTGTYILVPRGSVKVDTVKWSEDTSKPILTDKQAPVEIPINTHTDGITFLMPFSADDDLSDHFNAKISRFLQYYGGIQMAAEELSQKGSRLKLNIINVGSSALAMENVFRETAVKTSSVIVGPYEKEDIEAVAAFGLKNERMIISPWLPAFSSQVENPYFIQVNPGLSSHADAISNYIITRFPGKKVFLVSRDIPAEINRLTLFRKNTRLIAEDLIIDDASPDLARTDLSSLLDDDGTIFILPYYAKADETFVNSFLRKLHADKAEKEVTVFGLPQWLGFNNLNTNYLQSMDVHISASTFIDVDHPDYQEFRKKFYAKFYTIPDLQAFLGYDLVKWLAYVMETKGPEGIISSSSIWSRGIASGFNIKPVFKSNQDPPKEMKTPSYYENMRIRILAYRDQDFHLID